ncbi:hypothetical protein D9758_014176 [Tetrapyrgos nigripes]|uniref:Uncharacterized protein n=1 Tax=Tetrapyrgos nigripes TaxID=182062 RepID=A0A8H5CKD9_9AGAR|nr:hypothetical protein D9758_014176 [Tetrapyrgos nigripes]
MSDPVKAGAFVMEPGSDTATLSQGAFRYQYFLLIQIAGIAPTLIIVRSGFGTKIDNFTSASAQLSTFRAGSQPGQYSDQTSMSGIHS